MVKHECCTKIKNNKNNTKKIYYKVSFITLTLSSKQIDSDKHITKVLLGNFIERMRKLYNLTNYVWRAERQKNGNIHYHILTDTPVNYWIVKYLWNDIQKKNGYLKDYTEKYKNMNLKDYINEQYNKIKELGKLREWWTKEKIQKITLYFKKQQAQNWLSPNSVDVKTLNTAKEINIYISKYICKDEEENPINGRIWSRSQSISQLEETLNNDEIFTGACYQFARDYLREKTIYEDFYTIIIVQLQKIIGFCKKSLGVFYKNTLKRIDYKIHTDDVINGNERLKAMILQLDEAIQV